MEIIKAIVLGITQGATEFFPVSSSGHLVIIPFIFKWDYIPVYYAVTLHFATLLSLIAVFYRDIGKIIKNFILGIFYRSLRKNSYFKLSILIIIATIPAFFAGFFLNKYVENFFSSPLYVAFFLLFTAVLLLVSELTGKKIERSKRQNYLKYDDLQLDPGIKTAGDINFLNAIMIGLGQAIAIFPGLSRSGATISFGRFFGIKRQDCVRFSFLLSIPAIFGAFIFETVDSYQVIAGIERISILYIAISFVFAFASGFFAIKLVERIVKNRNLNFFAIYCILISVVVLILLFLRK